jgi:hypothetical protein
MASPVDPTPEAAHAPIPRESPTDWPAQAADQVVGVIDKARDATTGKVITAARALVYGIIISVLAATIAVLLLIFTIRLVTELFLLLPYDWVGVWCTYVLFGLVFSISGALVFRKRYPKPA